jgi:hypothetical protein
MIELEIRPTDLDGVRYGRYAIGIYRKTVIFKLISIVNVNMADERTCDVGSNLAPLNCTAIQ